ncbi:methyl-accepting chemotaxis protein [Derxia lacustris]|uniref:methyl-accepting chemotaxis protein n=1 Tax=Derxia lacustris TaxID=764842 RepID=UPI000A17534F|nr:methyl-accepting chemotaxis protein [Derxia lacustris]
MRFKPSISQLLASALGLLSLLFGLATVSSLTALRDSNDSLDRVNREIRVVLNLVDAINHTRTARVWLAQASVLRSSGQGQRAEEAIALAADKMTKSQASAQAYAATATDPAERALADDYMARYRKYVDLGVTPLFDAMRNNDLFLYMTTLEEHTSALDREFEQALDSSLAYREAQAKELNAQAERNFHRGIWQLVGFAAVFAALVLLLWVGAGRQVLAPLRQVSALLGRIADNDLSSGPPRVSGREPREVEAMLTSLSRMLASLHETISTIRNVAGGVSVASSEISQGTLDLSTRTERQAASLEETSATIHEMVERVSATAEATARADTLSAEATSVAGEGGRQVEAVVASMRQIQEASRRISDITSVIDGISFQTNILALNAAVEAARAGEHGRGFAVVAAEVRALAHRSTSAAKEINSLINDTTDTIDRGVQLVSRTGGTISGIVEQVDRVAALIGEIRGAAAAQSSGLGGVNASVGEIDQLTQQNAALVEQSAAATASLRDQAQHLLGTVNTFKLA